MLGLVLQPAVGQRDNAKRYRFTPSVSNWRMPDALSVDPLCGFGAKNIIRCTDFIQSGLWWKVNKPRIAGHFGALSPLVGSVMVRARRKWFISGRGWVVKPVAFAGMLPSCRLVRRRSGRALS